MERRTRIDFLLLIPVCLVVAASIFTLYTQEVILDDSGGRWFRQLVFFLAGLVLCFLVRKVNYQWLGSVALPFYGIALLLLLLTLLPFVGSEIKGARSWIRWGPVGLQTSEFAKLATILLLAKYLELNEREISRIPSMLIAFLITLLPMLLMIIQPDFGGAFVFTPILLSMIFIAGTDFYYIASVVTFFGVALSIPLYIEYHKITLVPNVLAYLGDLEQDDLLPAVRILKQDIWDFVDQGALPSSIQGTDRSYLQGILDNERLLESLQYALDTVRFESGGLLLLFL